MNTTRREFVGRATLLALVLVASACGGGGKDSADPATSTTETAADPTTTEAAADTTAPTTSETVGFQGLDDFDTSGIEVLPMTTLSLEYLASLQPDTIIPLQFWVDQIGADVLEGMADVIVVPDGLYGAERLTEMGQLMITAKG